MQSKIKKVFDNFYHGSSETVCLPENFFHGKYMNIPIR